MKQARYAVTRGGKYFVVYHGPETWLVEVDWPMPLDRTHGLKPLKS